jgi:hypothetical protein
VTAVPDVPPFAAGDLGIVKVNFAPFCGVLSTHIFQ